MFTSWILLFSLATSFPPANTALEEEVLIKKEIKGLYELRNLWIHNPQDANGQFCLTGYYEVNGQQNKIPNLASFEIRLEDFSLELGEPVHVILWHRPGCEPQFINPEVLDPSN